MLEVGHVEVHGPGLFISPVLDPGHIEVHGIDLVSSPCPDMTLLDSNLNLHQGSMFGISILGGGQAHDLLVAVSFGQSIDITNLLVDGASRNHITRTNTLTTRYVTSIVDLEGTESYVNIYNADPTNAPWGVFYMVLRNEAHIAPYTVSTWTGTDSIVTTPSITSYDRGWVYTIMSSINAVSPDWGTPPDPWIIDGNEGYNGLAALAMHRCIGAETIPDQTWSAPGLNTRNWAAFTLLVNNVGMLLHVGGGTAEPPSVLLSQGTVHEKPVVPDQVPPTQFPLPPAPRPIELPRPPFTSDGDTPYRRTTNKR